MSEHNDQDPDGGRQSTTAEMEEAGRAAARGDDPGPDPTGITYPGNPQAPPAYNPRADPGRGTWGTPPPTTLLDQEIAAGMGFDEDEEGSQVLDPLGSAGSA